MSQPTDTEARREFRLAAILTASVAAVFAVFAVVGVGAIAVAMPDDMLSSRPAPFGPVTYEPAPVAAAPAPVTVPDGHEGHTPAAPDPDAPLVVKVKMGEFFFSPSRITAPVGKTIRFEVTNPGVVPHELLVGDRHAQDEAEWLPGPPTAATATARPRRASCSVPASPGSSKRPSTPPASCSSAATSPATGPPA